MERNLSAEQVELFEKEFAAQPAYRLMQNAVTQTPVDDIALDRRIVTGIDHSVSHLLDDWKVTNQKKSGRCWMFAGLNLLRVGAAAKLGVKDFEFSQNYLHCWDKFERANYFLEAIIETSGRDVDDRTVAHLLSDADRRRRPVEHVRRAGPQARPGAEGGDAGDRELVRTSGDERQPCASCSARARATCAGWPRRAPTRSARTSRRCSRPRPPGAEHPPRYAAAAVPVAVEGRRQGLPPRRLAHAGGVRRRSTCGSRSTSTSAWCTTRGSRARSAGPSRSSTWAMSWTPRRWST